MKPIESSIIIPDQFSEIVLIDVSTTSKNTYAFPKNNENIEKGYVTSIRAWSAAEVALTPEGSATVNATYFKKAYLILQVEGEERFTNIPLYFLNPALNNGIIRYFNRLKIDFTKSKVAVPVPGTNFVANENFMIDFSYQKDLK
jgi:hypothetical protein